MKTLINNKASICKTFFALIIISITTSTANSQTIVDEHGQLSVDGNRIVNSNDNPVQLKGMSLFWSQWQGEFYNYDCIEWLRDDWNIMIIRTTMGVQYDGYLENPEEEKAKIETVIDAAIDLGIYVIINWQDHNANQNKSEAIEFFSYMAEKYGNHPNIIYEPWSEPLDDHSWPEVIKPYHETLVVTIREHDENNIILLGTRRYSQLVDEAAKDPVEGENLAYSLHFYAASHKEGIRNRARIALAENKAVFVAEYGTTEAGGDGPVDKNETYIWWDFMEDNMISHLNWSISDKYETSAALLTGASPNGGWETSDLSESGEMVRAKLREELAITNLNEEINQLPKIYPTIISTEFFISSHSQIDKIEIYNINGIKVKTINNIENTVNVSELNAGIYITKTYDKNNSMSVTKIIKK